MTPGPAAARCGGGGRGEGAREGGKGAEEAKGALRSMQSRGGSARGTRQLVAGAGWGPGRGLALMRRDRWRGIVGLRGGIVGVPPDAGARAGPEQRRTQ